MPTQEWAKTWHDPALDLRLSHAHYIEHAYAPHSHDYYVICIIDSGRQSFSHEGRKHYTPPGGLILINPGEVHTGEAAGAGGFTNRCLYPTVAQMEAAVAGLTGRRQAVPQFARVRVDDPWAHASVAALHTTLIQDTSPLERETRLAGTLAALMTRYGALAAPPRAAGRERQAVWRARDLIEARYADSLRLADLAAHVALSPYHLVRAFRAEFGLPPHAYLDNVRIRRAEQLIAAGRPLAQVAAETGYSSQSHLTRRFRQIIGVTPGQYARRRAA